MSESVVLGGRYEILSLLGTGGMGSVYRAHDRELDEIVALKMLRKDLASSAEILNRFRLEAKLARRVTHPNVARTFDIGEHEGDKFLTMELVEGESLGARLDREGRIPLHDVAHIVEAICAGLGAAHAAGVVHRDLKPDNVILGNAGQIKITDFGIARALATAGGPAQTLGFAVGTPAYMAPEQVEGASTVDGRADIYALGAMIFELVTGETPWRGDSIYAIAAARLSSPPPDPSERAPGVPTAIARVIQRCMARDPNDRFATAAEVATALAQITIPSAPMIAAAPSVRVQRQAEKTEIGTKTIAILPFQNLGAVADQHFLDGFTDDLVDTLSMARGLRTRPRAVVERLPDLTRDPRELGRELGVQVIVTGSLAKVDDRIHVRARLSSVEDGFQLWAKKFDRPATALFEVGAEVAGAIAGALAVEAVAADAPSELDPRALDLYLRARQQFRSDAGTVKDTVALFEQALAIAPDNPMILSGYAVALSRSVSYALSGEGGFARARDAAHRAIAAAPHLPEPHMALARLFDSVHDYVAVAQEVRAAAAISVNHADAHAHWGRLLIEGGDLELGMHRCRIALGLDDGLSIARVDLARAYGYRQEWSQAYATIAAAPRGNSGFMQLTRARFAMWSRDRSLAETVHREVQELPDKVRDAIIALATVTTSGALSAEERTRYEKLMTAGPTAGAFGMKLRAELLAAIGDFDGALADIERLDELDLMDLSWMQRCVLFEPIRAHATFIAITARVATRAEAVLRVLS